MSESDLNTYKLQLQQVEAALTTDPDNVVRTHVRKSDFWGNSSNIFIGIVTTIPLPFPSIIVINNLISALVFLLSTAYSIFVTNGFAASLKS